MNMFKNLLSKIRQKRQARKLEKQMLKEIYRKAFQDEKTKLTQEKAKIDARKEVFKEPFFSRTNLAENKNTKKRKN